MYSNRTRENPLVEMWIGGYNVIENIYNQGKRLRWEAGMDMP